MLNSHGDLAAVEIAFFAPALVVSVAVLIKHGFRRESGWIYLAILAILRLVGASATLYMQVNNDYSVGLYETAAITSAIGVSPLLLATLGFLQRVNEGMTSNRVSPHVFRLIHLLAIAALIIGIIGGVDRSGTDANTIQTGRKLAEVGSILFLVVFVALALIASFNAVNSRYVVKSEMILLRAMVLALPFLLVRIVYSMASAFSRAGSLFYYLDANIYLQAFMQFAMEAIVVILFIMAGFMTPQESKRHAPVSNYDMEDNSYKAPGQAGLGREPLRK